MQQTPVQALALGISLQGATHRHRSSRTGPPTFSKRTSASCGLKLGRIQSNGSKIGSDSTCWFVSVRRVTGNAVLSPGT